MDKKFVIAWVVMFIAAMLEGLVVHGIILEPEYLKLGSMMRPPKEQEAFFPYMILAHVILSLGFVWIYAKGKEARPFFAQGLRYGFAVSILATTPTYLIYYAVQPMPGTLVAMQICLDTIGMMILGVIVAWLYREPAPAAA